MNTDMRTYVITLLESYPKWERQIVLLHYELTHPVQILLDEMIEAMALSHGSGTGRPSGYISNRTFHIALHYQERAGSLNAAAKEEADNQLTELEQIHERMNYGELLCLAFG